MGGATTLTEAATALYPPGLFVVRVCDLYVLGRFRGFQNQKYELRRKPSWNVAMPGQLLCGIY